MKKILFTIFILSLEVSASAQSLKLYPRNEMYKDSSLTTFVCKLQYAIFKKDKSYLLSVLDPKIKNSFGGDGGIDEFKLMWELDSEDSPIWYYLSKMISLGGTFSEYNNGNTSVSFVFPYVFNMDFPNIDYFSVMAVTGENVNLREKPDKSSKVITQLSYDIVNVDYEKSYPANPDRKIKHLTYYGEKEWYYVTTMDKKSGGYIYYEYVWSPVGYRLFLGKTAGEWKIVCLVAGD